jgi:hypothetical protein
VAVTIGRVEEEVVFDGHGNIAQARRIGEEAGGASGDGYDKAWFDKLKSINERTKVNFRKTGEVSSVEFMKGWNRTNTDDAPIRKLSSALDGFGGALKRNRVQVENHGQSLRHWQAITLAVTALILGAGNDIAVLGSALGAGILTMASGILSLGIAGAVAVAIFKDLDAKLKKMPDSVKAVAQGFEDLKASFKDLQNELTITFVNHIGDGFANLSKIVKALTPNLDNMAVAIADVFNATVDGLKPGTKAFKDLQGVVDNAVATFRLAAKVIGIFGGALLTAFGSSRLQASVTKLLGWLEKIGTAFANFTASKSFDHWLDNADSVFGHIGKLLDSLGSTLNHLSSDKAVKSLNQLLDAVSRVLPTLGSLIDIGGKLDPLGLISQALDGITKAIGPLLKPLGDLAEAIHHVASIILDEWGNSLEDVSKSIGPLIDDFTNLLKGIDDETIRKIADALLALAGAFVIAKGAQGIEGLAKKMDELGSSVTKLSGKQAAMKGIAGGLVAGLATGITAQGNDSKSESNPLLKLIGEWASGAVAGFVVGGPIGAAIGLLGSIAASYIFQPNTIAAARTQTENFMSQAVYIPLGGLALGVQQQFIGVQTSVILGLQGFFGGIQGIWDAGFTTMLLTVSVWVTNTVGTFLGGTAQLIASVIQFIGTFAANWNAGWQSFYQTLGGYVRSIGALAGTLGPTILTAVQSGLNQLNAWWNSFWLGLQRGVSTAWFGITSIIRGQVNTIISIVNGLLGPINAVISAFGKLTGLKAPTLKLPSLPPTAVGGIFAGAQARIIGEAGPEAVVPLARDINRVSPSVRLLSAFAQGKLGAPASGPSKTIQVAEGAVQVIYTGVNPEVVGTSAMDRLIARFATA